MSSGSPVRHADAAWIHDLASMRQPGEWHVGVPADHCRYFGREVREYLGPPLQASVRQHDLLVVARRTVAEQHGPEPVDLQCDRMRQPGKPVDVIGCELVGPLLLLEDIVTAPLRYQDGQLAVPAGPGLGVELDEDAVTFHARR